MSSPILYFSLNVSTIISAIFVVIPVSLEMLQSNCTKKENAILFLLSVCQILPCVPLPAVCISAITIVPLGANFALSGIYCFKV